MPIFAMEMLAFYTIYSANPRRSTSEAVRPFKWTTRNLKSQNATRMLCIFKSYGKSSSQPWPGPRQVSSLRLLRPVLQPWLAALLKKKRTLLDNYPPKPTNQPNVHFFSCSFFLFLDPPQRLVWTPFKKKNEHSTDQPTT